jgi:hypothetical protein
MHIALSERPIICRCCFNAQWPVNNPVTSLHCFLSKANRPLDRSKYLIPSTAECTSFNPSLTLKPTIQGEAEIDDLRFRINFLSPP